MEAKNKNKGETYNRSRYAILSYILNFATKQYYGEDYRQQVRREDGFHGDAFSNEIIKTGSLCVLQSAPDSRWYMGWLMETREGGIGTEYLLKSIEDGSLCWWSNVGIKYYPKADEFPSWKWSDKQYDFKDKWFRATRKNNNYFTKPLYPVFHSDGSVTIGTRPHAFVTAIDKEDYRPTKTFPNWKKVKFSEMAAFYQYAVSSTPKNKKEITEPSNKG